MEFSLEEVLEALGMTADDARMDEDGEIYVPLAKALALCLDDEDDCESCDCDCDDDCDCCCDEDEDCDCDCYCDCEDEDEDEDEDDCLSFNVIELAQTYGVEILVNERNRAKELGQHEAYDALNFAVDVLLHQNALDVKWLADTYDDVVD